MGRKVNLKIQMHKQIDRKLAIGESRHLAKKAYKEYCKVNDLSYNAAKSPFIHSTATAEAYRQTVNEFSSWLKANNKEVWDTKDLSKVTKEVVYSYLQERQGQGKSAWTVTKDMSAINKILNLDLTKKEGNLNDRKLADISRSRGITESDTKYNEKNYADQIEIARAFGLRRESIEGGNFAIKESSMFSKDGNIYVSVIEKGGRYREAQCLQSYQNNIEQKYNIEERDGFGDNKNAFIEHYADDKSNVLFDRYTKKIDNHAFRAEYA